jgi:hypothetical protein
MHSTSGARGRLFGALPTRGIWTAFGLGRGQFAAILLVAVLLFIAVDGPVWEHLRDAHLRRIVVSYAVIPPAAALALAWNRTFGVRALVGASAVLGLVKLVITAALLALVTMARA